MADLLSQVDISDCPGQGKRRERRVSFADGADPEIMGHARRARTQPPGEESPQLSTALISDSSSAEHKGEICNPPPPPNHPGMLGPAIQPF